jgi:hypothetical protein
MSASAVATARTEGAHRRGVLVTLARLEARRYALHPLFVLGVLANVYLCLVQGPDPHTSVMTLTVAPAATIGILGMFVTFSLTRRSDQLATAAGSVPVPERARTMALIIACVVPFAAGLAWWLWAYLTYRHHPPPPNGYPFGPVSHGWIAAVLFGEAPIACLGGPLLGIAIARWIDWIAAPALVAVTLIPACIFTDGIVEPLRRIRVVMPWTYFGGPVGIAGDDMRTFVFTGSPQWWVLYLACLCALAAIAALWHDRDHRGRLSVTAAAVVVIAVASVLLSMYGGLDHTLINPLRSS